MTINQINILIFINILFRLVFITNLNEFKINKGGVNMYYEILTDILAIIIIIILFENIRRIIKNKRKGGENKDE